jgi:Xaa-Pro aminopeptidase
MRDEGVDVFLVPRADRFQGEYVAPSDERLAWLTGFTGSAGFAAILDDKGGAFRRWPLPRAGPRAVGHGHLHAGRLARDEAGGLADRTLPRGGTVGYDPWLHTGAEIARLTKALGPRQITLSPLDNLVDRIWTDRPAPPMAPAPTWSETYAGSRAPGRS